MLFNSFEFVLYFLPITLLVYGVAVRSGGLRFGNLVLLLASIVFYGFFGWKMSAALLVSSLVNYGIYHVSYGRYRCMMIGRIILIIANVGFLFVSKYYDFFVSEINAVLHIGLPLLKILIPIGLSFFTFSQISFVVYALAPGREKVGFWEYFIYIVYFPKLLMGPIVPFEKFLPQLRDRRNTTSEDLVCGMRLFVIGLAKKVLLADVFSKAVAVGFANVAALSSLDVIIVTLCYTFELYFDFSGYSDMAWGVSRIFNIDVGFNFNSPYKALSIRDFWGRWHISLTSFLTKHVYIPLGGSRCGSVRTYINISLVFLVSGLWHGANWTFILWGVLHGLFMICDRLFEKLCEKIPRSIRWAVTFVLVNLLWLLFRADSVAQWIDLIGRVGAGNWSVLPALKSAFAIPEVFCFLNYAALWNIYELIYAGVLIAFIVLAMIICVALPNALSMRFKNSILNAIVFGLLMAYSIVSLGSEARFIYSNF